MSREEEPAAKWGDGHVSGMLRQGLRELRAAIYPESNIAQPPVYGIAGELTPGEISESRGTEDLDKEEEKQSSLADKVRESEARAPQEKEAVEPERD